MVIKNNEKNRWNNIIYRYVIEVEMKYKVNYWYLKFIFYIVGIYLINCRAVDPAIILTTTCRQPAEQGTAADH